MTTPQWARDAADWMIDNNWAAPMVDRNRLAKRIASHAPGWVSVEERLPRWRERVLLAGKTLADDPAPVGQAFFERHPDDTYEWKNVPSWFQEITHWMPLPDPPQEVD